MGLNRAFWKDKKVFLTGHTGFKGSWLSLWLQMLGAEVVGYSLPPPTEPSMFQTADVAQGMRSVTGDVRDLKALEASVREHRPEILIHMAAQSLVRHSYKDPVETYSTNVMGTVNVLEAVRGSGTVRAAVVVTSDKCYENREWVWGYRENEPMGGHDPYSSSKGSAELVTAAYLRSFFPPEKHPVHGVALASVRAGNVIGGGDWAEDRLVPDIIRAFMEDRAVPIRNPGAVRPWQYVLEPLGGYLLLVERLWEDGPRFAGPWNFGPNDDDARPVSFVVETMREIWGSGSWRVDGEPHPHEAHYLKLDCSKAKSLLGWTPRLTLPLALRLTAEWYRAYRDNEDMRQHTFSDITRYEAYGKTPGPVQERAAR